MSRRIGILGTGNVGRTLGKALVDLGFEVRLGSRDGANDKAQEWAAQCGTAASYGTFAEAAAFGEIIILSTFGRGTANALRLAGAEHFAGKIVVDTTNPLDVVDGKLRGLFVGTIDSLGERVQRFAATAKVVKAFNITGWMNFINPQFNGTKPDMFICGNDADAKAWVAELCHTWGWRPVDMGPIEQARWIEPLVMTWITYAKTSGSPVNALKMVTA